MASPFRVLLVDDEPGLLEIGKLLLERAGPFLVETCGSADAALDLLAREPFDAVVSDYQMPEMDGIGLLALVRKQYGHLPFVLFTGKGREQVVIRAINEGADFYVQKGGDPGAQFAELAHKTRVAIERRATERELEERERRFRALIRNSSDIIRIIDRDGLIAYDSDSGPRILGYPSGSVLGRSPLEFVHPEDRELVRDALAAVYAGTSPGTPTGFRVRHADGRWVAVESVAANLLGTPGVDGIVTTTWPVEARRRAEEALLLSERRFRRAEEIAGLGHWELCLETGTIHASRGAQSLYGLYGDERPLADVQEVPLPEYRPLLDRALRELVEQGRPYEVEFAIRRADDGRRRELRSVAEYDPDRQTVFGILHDITDRKRAEDALRAGEERYRTLAEDMPVYFCTFLPDGTTHVRQHGPRGDGRGVPGGARRAAVLRDDLAGGRRVRAGRARRAHPRTAGRDPRAVRPCSRRHPAMAAMDEPCRLRRGRAARPVPGRRPRHHRSPRGRGGPPPGEPGADTPLGDHAARHRQPARRAAGIPLPRPGGGGESGRRGLPRAEHGGRGADCVPDPVRGGLGRDGRPPAGLAGRPGHGRGRSARGGPRRRARGKRPAGGPPRLGGPDLHAGRGRPHRERAPPRRLGHERSGSRPRRPGRAAS